MIRTRIVLLTLATAVAGCGERESDGTANVQVPGPAATQTQLETMPEGQRNAVFIRAIRDARQECQQVESSSPAGEHQGFPVWSARCDGGAEYQIVIQNNGTASVLNTAEAALAGDNEAAPANAQGQ